MNKTPSRFENRLEWADKLEQYRLHEVDDQIAAIRRGMGTIVPVQLLPLFTWQELQLQICGRRDIDVDFLKVPSNSPHCVVGDDAAPAFVLTVTCLLFVTLQANTKFSLDKNAKQVVWLWEVKQRCWSLWTYWRQQ